MASEWPAFVALPWDVTEDRDVDLWQAYCETPAGSEYVELAYYIHRDAARAWQAFRDFLNGTADQWIKKVSHAEHRGYNEGWKGGRS